MIYLKKNSCRLRLTEVNLAEARLTVKLNRTTAEIFLPNFHLNDCCFTMLYTKEINTFWGLWGLHCSSDPSWHFMCL